jgi:hypothetical protein
MFDFVLKSVFKVEQQSTSEFCKHSGVVSSSSFHSAGQSNYWSRVKGDKKILTHRVQQPDSQKGASFDSFPPFFVAGDTLQ